MSVDKLVFYNVKDEYIEYLIEVDDKVMFNKPEDNTRPYVGFVLKIDELDYLVPLSSKLRKTNDVTTIIPNTFTKEQLESGEYKNFPEKIAIIKFNCMIPIIPEVISKINLNEIAIDEDGQKYRDLLVKEINFCADNRDRILKKASKAYKIYNENKPYMKEIVDSCCDFKKLEEACKEYKNNLIKNGQALKETAASVNNLKK
ncbi:type III toxin-antitoxin system ToxN/AbiQ family toxin [Desnuesiella massiliensis]|uniref:type III toxin-antitoxin system ToxN/AbiQ family toxin n=1 Tax=Desnuesiella massiliensis TaxID=1650662 RepID=UPI0006E2BDD3|nr:type III toxin-antitoxin system ToxN/AbiQ family toxin [Desnuesiella massiliensis]